MRERESELGAPDGEFACVHSIQCPVIMDLSINTLPATTICTPQGKYIMFDDHVKIIKLV